MRKLHFFIALSLIAASSSTHCTAQTPDISESILELAYPSLGSLMVNSNSIFDLQIEKVLRDENAIVFECKNCLKGKIDGKFVFHVDKKDQTILTWVQPGMRAVYFLGKYEARTCFGNQWYLTRFGENDAQKRIWTISPFNEASPLFMGPVDKLSEHVKDILAEKEVIVTAAFPRDEEEYYGPRCPVPRDWQRGKKGRVCRIRAGLKLDDKLVSEESSHFVGWGMGGAEVVPGLVESLKNANASIRAEAAEDLGQIGPDARKAVGPLIEALTDADGHVRIFAAEALARIEPANKQALAELVRSLKEKDASLRIASAVALAELAPQSQRAVPPLVELLRDKDAVVRSTASYAMREICPESEQVGSRPRDVVDALARVMLEDEDETVRNWAARALLRFGPEARSALPSLTEAMKLESGKIPEIAADTIARLGPQAIPVFVEDLRDPSRGSLRIQIFQNLSYMGPVARMSVPALIGALHDESYEIRFEAAQALLKMDKDIGARAIVSPLIEMIKNEQCVTRMSGYISFLDSTGPEAREAVPFLRELLAEENPRIRKAAAEALGNMGRFARNTTRDLRTALKDQNLTVRIAAAEALWKIEGSVEEILPIQLEALAKRHQPVAFFGKLGHHAAKAVPALVDLTKSEATWVRITTIEALGEIGADAREAIPVIRRLLDDKDYFVRFSAALALWRISGKKEESIHFLLTFIENKSFEVRFEAILALTTIDRETASRKAVPVLIELLKDEDSMIRWHAAKMLADLGADARSAKTDLVVALRDRDRFVRSVAAGALFRIEGQPEVILEAVRKEPESFWEVSSFLAGMQPEARKEIARAAMPGLRKALRNEVAYEFWDKISVMREFCPEVMSSFWGVDSPRQMPWENLSNEQLQALWVELASEEGRRYDPALWTMVLARQQAVVFLKAQLHPVPAEVTPRLSKLIADLDDEQFAVREKAKEELEKMGHAAEIGLLRTLKNPPPSLEVRRRVDALLEKLDADVAPPMMRELRALRVLERIGSPESSKILEHVASGAAEARLTREAKMALRRLNPFGK